MAAPNVGQRVVANWETVVGTKPEDQIHDDYWLMNQFSKGKGFRSQSGGDFVVVPLEYAINSTAGSYSDTDTFSTTRIDVFDRANAEWKENIVTVVISELEKDRNAGEGQVFALLPAKMESARNSMKSQLNTQMFSDGTGNSSKDITGLQALVASSPSTGTVQGINRANFTFWRNQQASGIQTTSAFDNLRAVMRNIYNSCSHGVNDAHPTMCVTTQTVFEGYEGLLLANERFTSKESGEGAFKNESLKFKGAMIAYDNDCPAGLVYLLNPQFLKLVYKSGAWMKARAPINPANQTVDIISIRSNANLVAIQPRRLGVVTAIS